MDLLFYVGSVSALMGNKSAVTLYPLNNGDDSPNDEVWNSKCFNGCLTLREVLPAQVADFVPGDRIRISLSNEGQ